MAKSLHPHFSDEQEILHEIWLECNDQHSALVSKMQQKQIQKKTAVQNDKEGSGEVAILKRDISELEKKNSTLSERLRKPYFGKIKFVDNDTCNTIYIGNSPYSCFKADVVSWQSPVANIYYSRKGIYDTPERKNKTVELHLVRTLDINRNVLNNIHDNFSKEEQLKADPFLLEQLGRSGKERLQDIVITIQEEQNEIIRAPIDKHLIVQGSAGTGKTIVLVYRVAYLMYTYEWGNDDVLFISPSKVFLGYLRSILPDADLANISNVTLSGLIPELGKNLFKKLSDFPAIIEISKKERKVAADAADFKGTLAFKRMIDLKIEEVSEKFAETIKSFNYKYMEKQEKVTAAVIRKWFLEDFARYSLDHREKMIRERIKSRLENLLENSLFNNQPARAYTHQETESMLANYFKEWPDFKKLFQAEVMPWYFNLLKSSGEVGTALENAQTKISENVAG